MMVEKIDDVLTYISIGKFDIRIQKNPNVWIPTEYAKHFLTILHDNNLKGIHVCDVGTGSGVLGILAALMGAEVVALDLNPDAICQAQINAAMNNVQMTCLLSDVFSALSIKKGRQFDIIICNPPTLPGTTSQTRENAAQWNENGNGRTVLDMVLMNGCSFLSPGGKIIASSSSEQGWERTKALLKQYDTWRILKTITLQMDCLYEQFCQKWYKDGIIKRENGHFVHDIYFFEAVNC
jgi:methylase of polypeptide subunit release factors